MKLSERELKFLLTAIKLVIEPSQIDNHRDVTFFGHDEFKKVKIKIQEEIIELNKEVKNASQ